MMNLSHLCLAFVLIVSVSIAPGQSLDKVDTGILTEIPPPSGTAPLAALLAKATPRIMAVHAAKPPKPPPALPPEWRDFTQTSTQNPAAMFVGTLVSKEPDGKFTISSEPILLVNKECKPSMTIDSKEDKVYTNSTKVQAGTTIDLVAVKLTFGRDEAVELTLSRVGGVAPAFGIDKNVVDGLKNKLDIEHNKGKYWICTGQELFVTTYQKFHKDKGGGSGSYSVLKIDGTYFREMSELKKLYNFRLQLVPLEGWFSN